MFATIYSINALFQSITMSNMEHRLSRAAKSAGTPDLTSEPSAFDSYGYVPTEADAYAVAAAAVAVSRQCRKSTSGASIIDLAECDTHDAIPPLPSQDSDDDLPPLPSLPSPVDAWDLAYLYKSDPNLRAAAAAEAELQNLNRGIQEHLEYDEYYKAKLLTHRRRLECATVLIKTTDGIDDKGTRLKLTVAYADCADALKKLHVDMDGVAAGNIDPARAAASAAAAAKTSS